MQPSDAFKLRKSYFHALGKANTEATQNVYESSYKSLGNITNKDVWIDSIPYCETATDADNFASANPTVCKKYTQFSLTEVPGSNGQAWYCDDSGTWIRPWISPVDVPDETTNQPSTGFQLILYQEDGTYIPPTVGVWIPDYYAGMVYFQEGYTPSDQGWGNVKATFYAYIGKTLDDSSIATPATPYTDSFVVDTTIITNKYIELSFAPDTSTRQFFIFHNGLPLEENIDYTISGNKVNFTDSFNNILVDDGYDKILVKYYY